MTRWTEEEEEFVRNNWDSMSIQDIADELDRTYKSVRNKGKNLVPGKKERQDKKTNKRWTEDEEDYLEENWTDMKIMDLADELDRTYSSVRYKSTQLGLPPKDQVMEDKEVWTDKEEEFLMKNWEDLSTNRLQEELDRSRGSIRAKAGNMGLPNKNDIDFWTEEETEFLRNNYRSTPIRAIADELEGRTVGAVESKARKMGLLKYDDMPVDEKEHEFTTVNHKIDIDSDAFKLIPLGDIHLGHPACDEERLFNLLDDLKEMDDPYGIVLMGDLWEGATTDSPNFQFSMKYPPQKQYQNILAIMKEFAPKVLGAVVGNHEDFARNVTGYQKMKDFCRELEIPFLKYSGAINLQLNGINYQIVMAHGSSGARTWGGRINALTRMNNIVPDASLFLYGHCLDEDTEVLTTGGWKTIDTIEESDVPLTFNRDTGRIERDEIKEIVKKNITGKMVHFKNKIVDYKVTPNHKIIYKEYHDGEGQGWLKREARDIKDMRSQITMPLAASLKTEGTDKTDDEISLTGWLISEGEFRYKISGIKIYQREGERSKEIEDLLNRMELEYSKYCRNNVGIEKEYHEYCIKEESAEWIRNNLIDNKRIPDWCWDMNDRQFDILFSSLIKGDGNKINDDSGNFIGKDEELIDDIQSLLTLHGYRSKKRYRPDHGWGSAYEISYNTRENTSYSLSGTPPKEVDYEGRVWSLRTNNLTQIARSKGRVFMTGNTHSKAVVTDAKYRSIGEGANKKERKYILTGSFMNYPGTYADKKNYPPTSLGIVPVELRSDKKKIITRL